MLCGSSVLGAGCGVGCGAGCGGGCGVFTIDPPRLLGVCKEPVSPPNVSLVSAPPPNAVLSPVCPNVPNACRSPTP